MKVNDFNNNRRIIERNLERLTLLEDFLLRFSKPEEEGSDLFALGIDLRWDLLRISEDNTGVFNAIYKQVLFEKKKIRNYLEELGLEFDD